MLTIHVIAPFHSRLLKEKWSHCAFTQITLKQIEIFKQLGARVLDYSNYGSESCASEHIPVLSKRMFDKFFSDDGMPGHKAEIGSAGWRVWNEKLTMAVKAHAGAAGKHIVAHTFADAASSLLNVFPEAQHFEPHVGYERAPFGAKRVYVSEAWRHFLWGKYPNEVGDRRYSWVVLPYYGKKDWPLVEKPQDYIAYMGRVTSDKGISTIQAIASARPDWRFKIAGAGDTTPFNLPTNVKCLGVLAGKDRAAFLGNARALLCPTEYVEPCAGVVCEAAMTGTPTVASSWGGFMETIVRGETGYQAATLAEWIAGVNATKALDREHIAKQARERFSLEAATTQYERVVDQLLSLAGRGWYSGVDVPAPETAVRSIPKGRRKAKRRTASTRPRRHAAVV